MFLGSTSALFVSLLLIPGALAAAGPRLLVNHNSSETYYSRPDIVSPILDVQTVHPEAVSEAAYWFMTITDSVSRNNFKAVKQSRHVGPYIYDTKGNLVWSGAALFRGRSVFNFQPVEFNGSTHLSLMISRASDQGLSKDPILEAEEENTIYPEGAAIFLDTSYQNVAQIPLDENTRDSFNIHELKIVNNGKRALKITSLNKYWQFEDDGSGKAPKGGEVDANWSQEVDTSTGEIIFEWDTLTHIPLSMSMNQKGKGAHWGANDPTSVAWDYVHLNSVEKDSAGDYLISARYTYTIYKISHLDGSIIWSLDGQGNSPFTLLPEGFNFSHQHDARIIDENHTTNISLISFLNNAADFAAKSTAETSAAYLVALNNADMTATLVGQWPRPDGSLTRAKGNVQVLDGPTSTDFPDLGVSLPGNVFVGWGANGYLSEFAPSGECVQSARFLTDQYGTYRIFKYDFVASPRIEEIAIFASSRREMDGGKKGVTTTVYMSWNGATEVDSWSIYSAQSQNGDGREGQWNLVGNVKKYCFETSFTSDGYLAFVHAQALDSNRRELGNTSVFSTLPPNGTFIDDGGSISTETDESVGKAPSNWNAFLGNNSISVSWSTLMLGLVFLCLLVLCILMTTFGLYRFLPERWTRRGKYSKYSRVPGVIYGD